MARRCRAIHVLVRNVEMRSHDFMSHFPHPAIAIPDDDAAGWNMNVLERHPPDVEFMQVFGDFHRVHD